MAVDQLGIAELVAIVGAIAALDCEVTIPVSSLTDETATICIACNAVFDGTVVTDWESRDNGLYPVFRTGPTDHDPECPWRRARAWIEQHEDRAVE